MEISTISKEYISKITERKSIFYGYVMSAKDEEQAKRLVEKVQRKHKDANHVAYAYRLLEGQSQVNERYYDDGEPSKTAGFPLLRMLQHKELVNAIVIVARVFGGIKLGTSGLMKAYGTAGLMAIEEADIHTGPVCEPEKITIPLEAYSKAEAFLHNNKLRFTKNFMGGFVTLDIEFPVDMDLQSELKNIIRDKN